MNFRDFLLNETYEIDQPFIDFLDLLSNYMDLADKSVIDKIYEYAHTYNYIREKNKVYRIMCVNNDTDFGRFKLISTSTKKLKGKVLDNIINDMKDRYTHYRKTKECKLGYVELKNVKGVDIESIGSFVIANKDKFDDYYVDMFKRLKSEKEFLVINKDLKAVNIEYV